jgi:hypothetical protein
MKNENKVTKAHAATYTGFVQNNSEMWCSARARAGTAQFILRKEAGNWSKEAPEQNNMKRDDDEHKQPSGRKASQQMGRWSCMRALADLLAVALALDAPGPALAVGEVLRPAHVGAVVAA